MKIKGKIKQKKETKSQQVNEAQHIKKKGQKRIKQMRGKSFTKQLQQPSAAALSIIACSAQHPR